MDSRKNPIIQERLQELTDEAAFFEHRNSISYVNIGDEVSISSGILFDEIPSSMELNVGANSLEYFQDSGAKIHLQALAMETDSLFPEIIATVSDSFPKRKTYLKIEIEDPEQKATIKEIKIPVAQDSVYLKHLWEKVEFRISTDSMGISGAPLLVISSGQDEIDQGIENIIQSNYNELPSVPYFKLVATVVAESI